VEGRVAAQEDIGNHAYTPHVHLQPEALAREDFRRYVPE
jgi:hypothetical protein